jgi:hypothetical protein
MQTQIKLPTRENTTEKISGTSSSKCADQFFEE